MDKLNRKAPSMDTSELALDRVNMTIRSVKMLLEGTGDDFVEEIKEFVPAGETPEYRDVVLELSQLKAGLKRYGDSQQTAWRSLNANPYG